MTKKEIKLKVNGLKISFNTDDGKVQAVRGVSFDLYKGETLAIVGESGSGKSVTTRAVLGISANNAVIEEGEILYNGLDLTKADEKTFHSIRGDKIAMVFQDPLSALDPIVKVGKQITESMLYKNRKGIKKAKAEGKELLKVIEKYAVLSLKAEGGSNADAFQKVKTVRKNYEKSLFSFDVSNERLAVHETDFLPFVQRASEYFLSHGETEKEEYGVSRFLSDTTAVFGFLRETAERSKCKLTKNQAKEKALKLMEEVGIAQPERRFYEYPFQLSGGMRQRIVIAIALSADPEVLICDEPTTALDVTIQAQILELIGNVKKQRGLSVIFITHDLGVVANIADRVAVMYAGKIVEIGTVDEIFYEPTHPYTWALLSSMPDLDTKGRLDSIPGAPPNMIYPPQGDAFAPRNKYALKIDFEKEPPLFKITDTHYSATWLLHPSAPKVEPPQIIKKRAEEHRRRTNNG